MMWPFDFRPVYAAIDLNVSDLPYDPKLTLFVKHEDVSPFTALPYTVETEDLPERIPSTRLCSLPLDVTLEMLDRKEKLTFWILKLKLAGDYIAPQEWSAYVVVNSTSPRQCNKILEAFLNEELALNVYVKGQQFTSSYFTNVARVMIGRYEMPDDNKVVRSEN